MTDVGTVTQTPARPAGNALGMAAFIIGLIGLVISFVPFIGMVSWILAPLAILCGLVALLRPRRSLAVAGIVTGALALAVCFWWVGAAKSVGEALNQDTFNTTGKATDLSAAPILDASIRQVWSDMEANKVAAGSKYGGHRLRFTNEAIRDFTGDSANPAMQFLGKEDEYMTYSVGASFDAADGPKIGALKKGDKVTFVCEDINESFGEGYSLGGCKLQ